MKVDIAEHGRVHAFELARGLQDRGSWGHGGLRIRSSPFGGWSVSLPPFHRRRIWN